MKRYPTAYKLAFAATALAAVVVMLGAYTRLMHAGLGCPDWPGCYGFLAVPHSAAEIAQAQNLFPDAPVEQSKGWPEMIHRYFVGGLFLMVLALTTFAVKNRHKENYPVKLSVGILVLIIVQALFGMWTVTLKLWPQIVTSHLLGGFAMLSLLFLLTLRLSQTTWQLPTQIFNLVKSYQRVAMIGLVIVIGQIFLGGWTSANYAAFACADLLTCQGKIIPPMDLASGFNIFQSIGPNYLGGLMHNEARTAIHVMHRLGAVLTSIYTVGFIVCLWSRSVNTSLRKALSLLAIALTIQISLGISNVLFMLPLKVAVLHNLGGAFLLLMWVNMNYRFNTAKEVKS